MQQVPRRCSPQQITVIQPQSICHRRGPNVNKRQQMAEGADVMQPPLLRRPGAPRNRSSPAQIHSAMPGKDGAPQLHFA